MRTLRLAFILSALFVAGAAGISYTSPPVAAAACPKCYGMEKIGRGLLVDSEMPAEVRNKLKREIAKAAEKVTAWFGSFETLPVILACSTEKCDRKLGGLGAKATTFSTPFATLIRMAPSGLNETILAHEFAHVETHRRIGILALLGSRLPAWFDEGLATIISNDSRYIYSGSQTGCVSNRAIDLPVSFRTWGPMAGKDNLIYADAACRVLGWMDRNGGKNGVLLLLERIGSGESYRE